MPYADPEKQRAYYQANRAEIREYQREHYAANREERCERQRDYAAANREHKRGYEREHYAAEHREELAQASRLGQPWTGPERELAARTDLTAHQVALMTGRTSGAVHRMRRTLLAEGARRVSA